MLLRLALLIFALLNIGSARAQSGPAPAVRTFPYRAVGSTILVPIQVAGSRPRWFVLDSGANSCVFDRAVARQLRLRPVGAGSGSGAGAGPVPYDTYRNDIAVAIAGVPFPCLRTIGIDLSSQPAIIGAAIDGIVGTDLFSHFVVETDYELQVVRLYDRTQFSYAGGGTRIPFTLNRRLPIINVTLTAGGQTAERPLLVDSGSQSAIDDDWILRSPALRDALGGVGLGQAYTTRSGRFSEARLGPFRFSEVPGVAGGVPLIGGELLQRFIIIYDWPRQQIVFEPHSFVSGSVGAIGISGLNLRQRPDGEMRIEDVGADSPAARAGLLRDDIITTVDGTPARDFGLYRLTRLFRPFRAYRLGVMRSGQRREIVLTI